MEKLDETEIRDFYENVSKIWPNNNLWYSYLRSEIKKYIHGHLTFQNDSYILNAGSGGNDYSVTAHMHHVDIAENKIAHFPEYTVTSIEKLPFADKYFSDIICVGSIINYCDAVTAISELSRVLKKQGKMIFEFENSWGYEHLNKGAYKADSKIVELYYIGEHRKQWLYSHEYIKGILKSMGFRIKHFHGIHYLSALFLGKGWDENRASSWAKYDFALRRMPLLRWHANNIILTCEKI